jgi:hypothetical protein
MNLDAGPGSGRRPRRPGRRHTKTAMASDPWCNPDSFAHKVRKLAGSKATQNRDHSVVPAHWVKSQRPGGKPDPGGSKPTAANVADNDATARDTVELAKERDRVLAAKVMQHLGAEHDVERPIGNRQPARIGPEHWEHCVVRGERERLARIESHRAHRDPTFCGTRANTGGDVTETRSDIEERDWASTIGGPEKIVELREHGMRAPKKRVGARDVAHRLFRDARSDRGIVEILVAVPTARRQQRHVTAPNARSRRGSTGGARPSSPMPPSPQRRRSCGRLLGAGESHGPRSPPARPRGVERQSRHA